MKDWHRTHAGALQSENEQPVRGSEQRRRDELNRQADIIEWVLENHKLNAAVTGGMANQRMARFQLLPAPGIRINQVSALSEELALHLGVEECRISRNGAHILVEIPLADPEPVALVPLLYATLRRPNVLARSRQGYGDNADDDTPPIMDSALLGIDDRDALPLLLKLASPDVAHVMLSGNTGSGKTVLARSIILSLAFWTDPADLRMILIDPKRRGYAPFAGLPHLAHPLIAEAEQAVPVLEAVVEEMLRRDAQSVPPDPASDGSKPAPARKGTRGRRRAVASDPDAAPAARLDLGPGTPRIVIVIDELADLVLNGGTAGREIARLITRLTQRGREANIHVIACTQKPSTELLGGVAKNNFPTRLVGRVSSADDARVAAGIGGTGAERLLGQGDFLLVCHGEVRRFQAAHVSAQEIQREVRDLKEKYDQILMQSRREDKARQQRARQFQQSHLENLGYDQEDGEVEYGRSAVREPVTPYRASPQVLPPPSRPPVQHQALANNQAPVQPPARKRRMNRPAPEPEPEFVAEPEPEPEDAPVKRTRSKKEMLLRFLRG